MNGSATDPTTLVTRFLGHGRVTILGDLILDRFVQGAVERISPEAPIPVLRVTRRFVRLGGAGNVAANVASLGGEATLVGLIGEDDDARGFRELVSATPYIVDRAVVDPSRKTTVKTRFIAAAQQLLRVDDERPVPLSSATRDALLDAFAAALPASDAVVLSDYAKGVLDEEMVRAAIGLATAARKPIIADPKNDRWARYRGVTVLTPNRLELERATGQPADTDERAAAAAEAALPSIDGGAILVTRSEKGMTLCVSAGPALHLPTEAREIADVSGAGDTVVGTLALALGNGAALDAAAELANRAAGIVVGKLGTATVSVSELVDSFRATRAVATDHKIMDARNAARRVESWRSEGLSVGFTNGCFDLLHPGHVTLVSAARRACDRLVLALNSDHSIARLKGPGRPIQDERARTTVIASLTAVDCVVVFDEDTPIDLIEALRPDVLVKGADYRVDQVVGAEFVEAHGGKVVLVDLLEGHSTTGTIARLGARAEAKAGD